MRNFEMTKNTYVCPSFDGPFVNGTGCLGTQTVHLQQSEGNGGAHLRPNFTQAVFLAEFTKKLFLMEWLCRAMPNQFTIHEWNPC